LLSSVADIEEPSLEGEWMENNGREKERGEENSNSREEEIGEDSDSGQEQHQQKSSCARVTTSGE
jgi:hypothetical protein